MHIVLYEPEIHWNTGNIGRTCVATDTSLHLVGRLGFELDDKSVRRAGLDYWPKVKLFRHKNFETFLNSLEGDASLLFFSKKVSPVFWGAPFEPESYLVFGSESKGLPQEIHDRFAGRFYRIPIGKSVRSLNLSTAAGIALYEGLRQTRSTAKMA